MTGRKNFDDVAAELPRVRTSLGVNAPGIITTSRARAMRITSGTTAGETTNRAPASSAPSSWATVRHRAGAHKYPIAETLADVSNDVERPGDSHRDLDAADAALDQCFGDAYRAVGRLGPDDRDEPGGQEGR